MAVVINKNQVIFDVCSLVGKGCHVFDSSSRPQYKRTSPDAPSCRIGSVGYDPDCGSVCYTLVDSRGRVIPSEAGLRRLTTLDGESLTALASQIALDRSLAEKLSMRAGRRLTSPKRILSPSIGF